MKALAANNGLANIAQQYTEAVLANPDTTTDVTLLMANSTPVITCTNEVDALLTSSGDVQQLFDNGVKGNAITLAAINTALTSFGGFFTNDPTTGAVKGTIILAQGVSP